MINWFSTNSLISTCAMEFNPDWIESTCSVYYTVSLRDLKPAWFNQEYIIRYSAWSMLTRVNRMSCLYVQLSSLCMHFSMSAWMTQLHDYRMLTCLYINTSGLRSYTLYPIKKLVTLLAISLVCKGAIYERKKLATESATIIRLTKSNLEFFCCYHNYNNII